MMDSFNRRYCRNLTQIHSRPNVSVFQNKTRLQCGFVKNLHIDRWMMISPGLDDFRNGPPDSNRGAIIPSYCAKFSSVATTSAYSLRSPKTETPQIVLKECLSPEMEDKTVSSSKSKISMLQKKKTRHQQLKEFENRLRDNPMLLIPHLEKSLPHEIFERLIKLIGVPDSRDSGNKMQPLIFPEIQKTPTKFHPILPVKKKKSRHQGLYMSSSHLSSQSAYDLQPMLQKIIDRISGFSKPTIQGSSVTDEQSQLELCESFLIMAGLIREEKSKKSFPIDPYKNFMKRIHYTLLPSSKKRKIMKTTVPELEETDIQKIAEEFCDWIRSLGGQEEKLNLDPDKILSWFAVQVETVPQLTAAIHVLTQMKLFEKQTDIKKHLMMLVDSAEINKVKIRSKQKKKIKVVTPPKFVRYKYGSWYIDVEEWKKLLPGEPLEDPEDIERRRKMEEALSANNLDIKLGKSFTCKRLQEHFETNNLRMPYFLRNVNISSEKLPDSENVDVNNFYSTTSNEE